MHESVAQPELYRLLIEHSLGLLCIHDLDGVLLAVNPAVGESLGYSVEQGTGRNIKDFLVPSVQHLFKRYLERIRSNPVDSGLMRLLARDGTERIWFYRNIRYDDPRAGPLVLGHALDITERIIAERNLKQTQQQLKEAHDELAARVAERTRELQQANDRLRTEMEQRRTIEDELLRARKLEALGVLAGGIAHDFNNFLTVVMGNLELAQMQIAGTPAREALEQAAAACRRAVSLATQLLAFTSGGAPIRRLVSVAELVESTVHLARAGSPVSFEMDIAADLWSAELDAAQIGQALHNVLLNARQAMPQGGVINVRAENCSCEEPNPPLGPGRYVRISVRDRGCGIPSANLSKIFDPYFTTKQAGGGLGLATAYNIIARHGGHITVESAVGGGSTFSLYLPAASAPAVPTASRPHPIQKGSGRILVMDDQQAICRLAKQMLNRLGYEVECARDGVEAVAMYQREEATGRGFDAVLLDLTVPGGMGGKDAAIRLRAINPSVPLIVSSGYSDAPILAEFRKHGFDAVLRKPWTLAELGKVLKEVIDAT